MRKLHVSAFAILAMLAVGYAVRAEEAKEAPKAITLDGQMMCAKCELKEGAKCSDLLMVKDGDKEIRYNVVLTGDAKGSHVCGGKQNVKVTGTVAEKEDGTKVLTATKVEKVKEG